MCLRRVGVLVSLLLGSARPTASLAQETRSPPDPLTQEAISGRRACYRQAREYTVKIWGMDDASGKLLYLGSGFYTRYNDKPYVFTSNHVVPDKYAPYVQFRETLVFAPALLRGRDRTVIDFALLELANVDSLLLPTPARLGNSDSLYDGDPVFAYSGLPSVKESPTGHIAAAEEFKSDTALSYLKRFTRTDMTVYDGASGGPLVSRDECLVVGIMVSNLIEKVFDEKGARESKLHSRGDRAFAVPINDVLRILPELAHDDGLEREIVHAGFGFNVFWCNLPKPLCLPGSLGVFQVKKKSEAEKSGIRFGDVLVALDGKPVESLRAFFEAAAFRYRPGDTVELTILKRDAKTGQYDPNPHFVTIKLTALTESPEK